MDDSLTRTSPGTRPDGASQLFDKIGPYTLLRVLGEGGMGTVYLAEQKTPVERQVALKVIKLGMDTRDVIARFEAERQALAGASAKRTWRSVWRSLRPRVVGVSTRARSPI